MNGGPKLPPACLSCGSFKKGNGSIEYKKREGGKKTYGIVMCVNCLNNPDKIDILQIIADLKKSKFWQEKDIKLVRKALELFKKGEMKSRKYPDGKIAYCKK